MANRVSPSGNLSRRSSEIQLFFDPRVKLAKAYPRRGTPTSTAAMPFNPAPTLRRRLRRDIGCAGASFMRAAFSQPQSELFSLIADSLLFLSEGAALRDAPTATRQRQRVHVASGHGRGNNLASLAHL